MMEDEIPQQLLLAGIGYLCSLYRCQAVLRWTLKAAAPTSSYKKGLLFGQRSGFPLLRKFSLLSFIDMEQFVINK